MPPRPHLTEAVDARTALPEWLSALTGPPPSTRGPATALVPDGANDHGRPNACPVRLVDAADPLLRRAARAGGVTAGVRAADLLTLTAGIVLARERRPDPVAGPDGCPASRGRGFSPPAPGAA